MSTDLRYPIGQYTPEPFSQKRKEEWLADIRFLPNAVEQAVSNWDQSQLHTPYREGGWTVHQLVHHIADSHMNAYIRFKLGYTEDNPTIRPYNEKLWYEFLSSFTEEDFTKTVFHPEYKKEFTLWALLGMYAWHGRHHTAHITGLKERMGW